MDNIASFGYWVRRRRKAIDLTQDLLAQQVGCSVFTIRKIERDERRPSRQIAELLAEHLAIPTEEREYFLRMARGEFVASMPSPLEDLPPPAFLQVDKEAATGNDSAFVARELELTQLDSFLEDVLTGKGQVAFAIGEAGTGKTTLVQEFSQRAQATHSQLIVAGGNCQAFAGVGDPYLPFREILGLLSGDVEARWTTGAIDQQQARRLWATMPYAIQALVEHGPNLLDIFIPGPALIQRATSATSAGADWLAQLKQAVARQEINRGPTNRQQVDLFEQYIKVLHALARQRPIMLIIDDLQWADAGSINLLFHLGRQLEGSRILVLGIYRPADVAAGRDSERHPLEAVVNEFQRIFGDIHINLGQTEGQQFVETLLDSEPNQLDSEFREALYHQTQGHALFTVEMLRGMQARGDLVQDEQGRWIVGPTLDWQTLPARIEGAIGERIERLPLPLQETLKTASVEGEFFMAEVVARVQGLDEPQMIRQLSGVLDKQHGLVRGQSSQRLSKGGQRLSQYRFRHILFQRYLYDSFDDVERVYLHEAVGTALEQLFEGQIDEVAVQLARHFQAAGTPEKAIGYLQQAGERAMRLSAHDEAMGHFFQAVELLEALPDPIEYAHLELRVQIALGQALYVVKGSASLELEHTLSRARGLAEQLGATDQLFRVLWGLFTLNLMRGEKQQVARTVAEQCMQLAQDQQDPDLLIGAHMALGITSFYLGELVSAEAHFEQGLALCDPQRSAALISLYGQDPDLFCRRHLAWVKWFLGYSDQALSRAGEAIIMAKKLAHPFSLAGAQANACFVHYHRREEQLVEQLATETITLSAEHGAVLWKLVGIALRGWALAEQGQAEEGIKQIRQSLGAWSATGARTAQAYMRLLLTEAHLRLGQVDEGLIVLDKALTMVEETGEHYIEAEAYRLKGELLRMQDTDEGEVEQQFITAIDIARRQSAKSWELRATVSLGRLWQAQGKKEEARQILKEIYDWFTEGFDTVDLKEAKALLKELS